MLAAVRFRHGTPSGYDEFRRRLVEDWPAMRAVVTARSTQTNEVGRCAALLPVLADLPGPLALLEVGASAGLCLLLDRYRYDYGGGTVLGPADSPVTLSCELRGDPVAPAALPEIVWRAGLDLHPLDVTDADAVRWLETLVWPGEERRLQRLRDAASLAAVDPPRVDRGDLRTDLARLAAEAPGDATLVVLHSAVLAYLPSGDRHGFADQVSALGAVCIANEAPGVLPSAHPPPEGPTDAGSAFLVSRDDRPVAWADPHGAWLRRFAPTRRAGHGGGSVDYDMT